MDNSLKAVPACPPTVPPLCPAQQQQQTTIKIERERKKRDARDAIRHLHVGAEDSELDFWAMEGGFRKKPLSVGPVPYPLFVPPRPENRKCGCTLCPDHARRSKLRSQHTLVQRNAPVLKKCARCRAYHLLELDHIIPISQGGDNDRKNLQWLCRHHHKIKSANERRNRRRK